MITDAPMAPINAIYRVIGAHRALGLSNRWYPPLARGDACLLPSHACWSPPLRPSGYFCCDGIVMSLTEECRNIPPELKAYLAERFQTLLATASFVEALAGYLPGDAASQERLPELEVKLQLLAALSES
ncbi:MAG: hypothetical protein IPP10_11365 [Candidatus Competibacteraceae bacterium]|nr:hypothetical protein [Candidatus Competibacteraceae bacterium]